jgi:hypothetical protein
MGTTRAQRPHKTAVTVRSISATARTGWPGNRSPRYGTFLSEFTREHDSAATGQRSGPRMPWRARSIVTAVADGAGRAGRRPARSQLVFDDRAFPAIALRSGWSAQRRHVCVDEERPDDRAVQVSGSDQIFASERHVDVDLAVDDLARAGQLERLVVGGLTAVDPALSIRCRSSDALLLSLHQQGVYGWCAASGRVQRAKAVRERAVEPRLRSERGGKG